MGGHFIHGEIYLVQGIFNDHRRRNNETN